VITAKAFAGKHYAVYGLARSGIATVHSLLASGARVTAWDDNAGARNALTTQIKEDRQKTGAGIPRLQLKNWVPAKVLTDFDSIVVSPGVPLNRHPIAARAREAGVEIIGDIELFARARPELPPHEVVGITGTNGKSTTTALIHHILKTTGVPTAMGGNIGLPILAQEPLPEGGVYVLELSSYQIDLTQSLDCDVAVLLNITPDHLDRYESFEAYAASKMRLFEMQSNSNLAVFTGEDQLGFEAYKNRWESPHGVTILVTSNGVSDERLEEGLHEWTHQSRWSALQGPHNLQNALCAASVCWSLGLSLDDLKRGLETYPGLPHRMERIREKDRILFVNDSKATNPTATAPALAAFDKIRWICGGRPKTDSLDECAPEFGHVRKAYTIGEASELFARLLSPHMAVAECETLERAVGEAAAEAEAGDTILLSPACASFDQFRDFEDRGDQFRKLVEGL
jgi:UDP-N-acetylmuramoylalanine--D-glutamate ligase